MDCHLESARIRQLQDVVFPDSISAEYNLDFDRLVIAFVAGDESHVEAYSKTSVRGVPAINAYFSKFLACEAALLLLLADPLIYFLRFDRNADRRYPRERLPTHLTKRRTNAYKMPERWQRFPKFFTSTLIPLFLSTFVYSLPSYPTVFRR